MLLRGVKVCLKGDFRNLISCVSVFAGNWKVEDEMSSVQILVYIMVGRNHGI